MFRKIDEFRLGKRLLMFDVCFFFSSRRRHTRCSRDWSSDVCSSDLRISPFYRVASITTPTLFMGGDIDWNVPILGSEQMYEAMKTLGRTTELVVYPGEYHGFTIPSHIKDRMERFMAWYNHYVKIGRASCRER